MWAQVIVGAAVMVTDTDPAGRWPADMVFQPCPVGTVAGARWDGSAWTPPTPVVAVPVSVGRWQLRVVLAAMPSKLGFTGSALDDADALAAKQAQPVREAWSGAPMIERTSPTLAQLAPGIGFASADMDDAFVAAERVVL